LKTTQLKAIADTPSVNPTLNIWMGDSLGWFYGMESMRNI
jgi:hypothetical protein